MGSPFKNDHARVAERPAGKCISYAPSKDTTKYTQASQPASPCRKTQQALEHLLSQEQDAVLKQPRDDVHLVPPDIHYGHAHRGGLGGAVRVPASVGQVGLELLLRCVPHNRLIISPRYSSTPTFRDGATFSYLT